MTQLAPWIGEHPAHSHDRAIDRSLRRWDREDLNQNLAYLFTRQAKHASEHRDMRVDSRPEPRTIARRQARKRCPSTRRTAQPDPRVLKDQRHDHRQLVLLMADRITDPLLAAIKAMPTLTRLRQMLHTPINPLGRDHLTGPALMPRLSTRRTHRPLIRLACQSATLRPGLRRIRTRRHAAVGRATTSLALELIDLRAHQRDLLKQPKHQIPRLSPAR